MKTPREAFKENLWIGAKGGLLDVKHVEKMGNAVWLYLYLLRNQTGLNAAGEGIANYGHPLTLEKIGAEFKGMPARTIRKWTARLRREGYVRTENHSNRGLSFWIAKGKPKTRKVKITAEVARSMLAGEDVRQNSRPNRDASSKNSRPSWDAPSTAFRPDMGASSIEEAPQSLASVAVAGVSETPTPKGSTSENLSYYNKDARAKNARSPVPSFREVLKDKSVPRQSNHAELDERRRELLSQGERIKRDYPAKGSSPGKVLNIQPQEAIA